MSTIIITVPRNKIDFSKTFEERAKLKKEKTKYSPKGFVFHNERPFKKSFKKRIVVYVKNRATINRNTFKTTYPGRVSEEEIVQFLKINNIKMEDIKIIYFDNKPYDLTQNSIFIELKRKKKK
jgi:hypothetical protein